MERGRCYHRTVRRADSEGRTWSPLHVVTAAQRARLVVALALLNLILATVALTAGFVAPARPEHDIAVTGAAPAPSPSLAIEGSPAANPTPAEGAGTAAEAPPAAVAP